MKKTNFFKAILYAMVIIVLNSCGGKKGIDIKMFPAAEKEEGIETEWIFIDKKGEIAIDEEYDEGQPGLFYEGFAVVPVKDKDEKTWYVFINEDGEVVSDKYKDAANFSEGLAAVVEENHPIVYVNKSMEVVIDLQKLDGEPVEYAFSFSEGLAAFQNDKGLWGFFNKNGEVVIPAKYTSVSSFYDGFSTVTDTATKDGKMVYLYGVINNKGEEVIKITDDYDILAQFSEGLCAFKEGDEWGFLNIQGEKEIKEEFQDVTGFRDGYASVKKENEWGLIDKSGEMVIKEDYPEPIVFINGLAVYQDDQKYGYINIDDEEIVDADYDEAYPAFWGKNNLLVKDGDDYFFIDSKGEEVNKNEYEKVSWALDGIAGILEGRGPFKLYGGGVVVNFGTSDAGSGDIQPVRLNPAENESSAASSSSENEEDYMTADDNTVEMPTENTNNDVNTTDNSREENNHSDDNQQSDNTNKEEDDLLYEGNDNNSDSDGDSDRNNDQGNPDGSPDSDNYNGTGTGGGGVGVSARVGNRKVETLITPENNCNEFGIVKIKVRVNENGNVTFVGDARGTTVTSECLKKKAKDAAKHSKFSKSSGVHVEEGIITYIFENK
jgi:hypothetical protein